MSVNPWHPWHSVSVGEKVPSIVTAIIEIPRGSKNKYEIDADSGLLFLDRVLSSPMFYPINYGFIPQTYCDDGDPLDVMVIGQDPVHPLSMMDARVIGCLKMIDGGDADDKILAVHSDDPQFKHITDIKQLEEINPHYLKEIEQFFKTYKLLENKKVEIVGWQGKEEAEKVIKESIDFYNRNKDMLKK
ncbi:inorganic diphosphatase [Pigmentibacter sp. JX0631]|uniref:inorganic diphosphatase n=1 Tax=Pigmentibacter sp. JX0631 TaxID=2976982 RepID=UPI002468BDBE|nr:inorganic diphosphatase [Pigmentibacter sp. JX0631]WGL61287.1 inorganic diphosphatase [Pigmentibacter sp. JX0631]